MRRRADKGDGNGNGNGNGSGSGRVIINTKSRGWSDVGGRAQRALTKGYVDRGRFRASRCTLLQIRLAIYPLGKIEKCRRVRQQGALVMYHSARLSPVMALVPLPFGQLRAYASTLPGGKAFLHFHLNSGN